MSRRTRRSAIAAILLFAGISWSGCSHDDGVTGPGQRQTEVQGAADELTCVQVASEPVAVEACDLGAVLGVGESSANDVNDAGQVAVQLDLGDAGGSQAHVWSEADGLIPISGIDGWLTTDPYGINEDGVIVGRGTTQQPFESRGIRWNTMSGDVTSIFPPDGTGSAVAQAINDGGRIVGWSSDDYAALIWETGSTVASLLPAAGWQESLAADVNDSGDESGAAGYVYDGIDYQAAYWCCGSQLELSPLGALDDDDGSYATGINDATPTEVVGFSYGLSGTRAFLWEDVDDGAGARGTMIPLPDLGGSDASATDINDTGYVVGYSQTNGGGYHAVAWTPDRQVIDLGMPEGYMDSFASAINENGWVVGYGTKTVLIDGEEEDVASAILWRIDQEVEPPPLPPTAEELLQQLHQEIVALVDAGSLNRGQGRSLLVKVWLAGVWLGQGRNRKAIAALRVLNWQIWVFTKVGILTPDEAEPLWALTAEIIALLKGETG